MKKVVLSVLIICITALAAFADNKTEALDFFNNYVKAANSYSSTLPDMYSSDAKIIRQVVKLDGTTVDVNTNTATYIKQMKLGQAGARLRHYTNKYTNVTVAKITDTRYKVSSMRQPSGETYKLKTYMILQKQSNGKWLIVEEMMQTKEQIFLKYAK